MVYWNSDDLCFRGMQVDGWVAGIAGAFIGSIATVVAALAAKQIGLLQISFMQKAHELNLVRASGEVQTKCIGQVFGHRIQYIGFRFERAAILVALSHVVTRITANVPR